MRENCPNYGPYFRVFRLNTGKCGLEKTPYLDAFHAVCLSVIDGKGVSKHTQDTI